jgi:competence protein ComEA
MRTWFVIIGLLALAAVPLGAQRAPATAKSGSSANAAVAGAPINLNTATQSQLETLPGIGPKAAQRILEYRQKNGSFKKVEDLMNVKGIGEKSFLKLKPLITVADKGER